MSGTQEAIGTIVGLWYAFVQAVKNVLAAVWNFFSDAIEAIVNAWNTGVDHVKSALGQIATAGLNVAQSVASSFGSACSTIANLFIRAANTAIDAINGIIGAINLIPGINLGTIGHLSGVNWDGGASKIANTASKLKGMLGDAPKHWSAPTFEIGGVGDAFNQGKVIGADIVSGWESSLNSAKNSMREWLGDKPKDYWETPKLDYIDLSDAAKAGYQFGEAIDSKVSDLFTVPRPEDFGYEIPDPGTDAYGLGDTLDGINGLGDTLDGINGNTGDTAGNTADMRNALDMSDEDLSYLRDIAEREAINRYTTAEIKVEQTNYNTVDGETDLDGILNSWATDFAQKLEISGEGIHK